MLTTEDRINIGETIGRHGHLFDDGALDRLDELFTADVVYDVSRLGSGASDGSGVLIGIDAVRAAALALGATNPLAHLVTNVIVTDTGTDDEAGVRSKGLAVMTDGRCVTATYEDTVRRTPHGWRLAHRIVHPRREPLGGLAYPSRR